MPPKPWLTKTGPPRQDVSAIIQSQPTIKQQIPKISIDPNINIQSQTNIPSSNTPNTTVTSNNLNGQTSMLNNNFSSLGSSYGINSGGYGSSYGGYGSSYGGGYGSSYGGYGSSYGGLGGYGSYGMGGMGGYGRYGMMGNDPNNQKGFIMNTLVTLQSFGFLIQSFCQIGRSLDQNIQGLSHFMNAFTNLFKKMYNGIKDCISWFNQKTKNILLSMLEFIKYNILFMNKQDQKNRMKSLKLVMSLCIVLFVFTFYPLVKKGLNKFA